MARQAGLVTLRGITKIYPDGTVALRDVDFELAPGEIHGLLGENGAGKTTLMKILSGLLAPTRGRIERRGRPVRFGSPRDAMRCGIGMVHQHFALVGPFSALENIVLGREGSHALTAPKFEDAEHKLKQMMTEGGLEAPLHTPIELLPVGVQQRIEILKLLFREVELLILDEPTAVLTPLEVDELFQTLKRLQQAGKTIVFITHKLKEVLEITDRITVLRQGRVAGVVSTRKATPEQLATLMVGREVLSTVARKKAPPGEPLLEVRDLTVKNDMGALAVRELSFTVQAGEIFGIAGVEGNGQTELIEALTGLRPWVAGEACLQGRSIRTLGPKDLYRRGLAHIPEDRRRWGLILELSVPENSVLGLQRVGHFQGIGGRLRWTRITQHAREIIERFAIQVPGLRAPVRSLSGGNQQKLVAGRELSKAPSVVIAAQPTRGLDVAATQAIRDLLVKLRDAGKAILLVSADLDEILQISDRVGVMYEGRFVTIETTEALDREQLGLWMGGVAAQPSQERS